MTCLLSFMFLLFAGLSAPACDSDHSHGDDHGDDHGDHGDDGHHGGEGGDPASTADACTAMAASAHVNLAATADTTAPADANAMDTRMDVDLVEVPNGNGGYIHLTVTHAGHHLFFFDQHFSLKVFDGMGMETILTAEDHEIDTCSDVAMVLTFELAAGEYDLFIGPTSADTVSIVHVVDATGGSDGHGDHSHADITVPEDYAELTNPHSGEDAEHAGAAHYEASCSACHGETLAGDGAAAASLDPSPSDLADADFLSSVGDDYLYWRITEGGAMEPFESSMPGYSASLSDEERWQIVAYIRSHQTADGHGGDDHGHD